MKTNAQRFAVLFAVFAFVVPAAVCAQRPGEEVLFAFDDRSIPWKHNLKLSLVEAEKHPGNPVLRRGPIGWSCGGEG